VNAVHTIKEEHKKRSNASKGLLFFARKKKILTRPFHFPHFLPRTSISKRVLTLLLQKRVVVCLLSLSLLSYSFIATTARGVKIYI